MVEHLETCLLAAGRITPLAARRARVLSRSVCDAARGEDARIVMLLALAALEKGVPRAGKEYLRGLLAAESVTGRGSVLENEGTPLTEACAAVREPAARGMIDVALDALFRDPSLFAPLSGPVPAAGGTWPLLAVDAAGRQAGFSRYYRAVVELEKRLGGLLEQPFDKVKDETAAAAALASVFGAGTILPGVTFHVRQAAAVALAFRTKFLIVSGGPGTGKTSVVTQILRVLVRLYAVQPDRIVLCAPTGRAKARLGEIVDRHIEGLETRAAGGPFDSGLKGLKRQTIHGLLSIRPDGGSKYDEKNPLPYEVIVVDEASMVDLCLFSRLLEAVPPECRIILLGDMHQLPSVDAGAVLGDLTERFNGIGGDNPTVTGETARWIGKLLGKTPVEEGNGIGAMVLSPDGGKKAGPLADRTLILTKNYRTGSGEIHELGAAVNRGNTEKALTILKAGGPAELDDRTGGQPIQEWLDRYFSDDTLAALRALKGEIDLDAAAGRSGLENVFNRLGGSRILTLVHEGPRGRLAINRQAGKKLRKKLGFDDGREFFPGQPVIMTRNHHALDLYNGDTGMVAQEKGGGLRAVFRRGGRYLGFAVDRLAGLEPAFAMTVHKAQGSEFDEVLLVLPDDESPLLFRQIIYTGITRARSRVVILGSPEVLRKAIENHEVRPGGVAVE